MSEENNNKFPNDDLALLKVELKKIFEQKPPNERIISYIIKDQFENE